MRARYTQRTNGEWFEVGHRYIIRCCDCGLVHDVRFKRGKNGVLLMRADRNDRRTAAGRRGAGLRQQLWDLVLGLRPSRR